MKRRFEGITVGIGFTLQIGVRAGPGVVADIIAGIADRVAARPLVGAAVAVGAMHG